jgi:Protein of unknown function (DUF2934)
VPVSVNTTQKVLRSAPIPSSRRPAAIEEVIRRRAYQLYVEGGRREGHTKEDWLRAESEVLGSATRTGIREHHVVH